MKDNNYMDSLWGEEIKLPDLKSTKESDKKVLAKSTTTIPYEEYVKLEQERLGKENERLAQPYTLTVGEYENLIKRIEELERKVKYDCVKITFSR